MKQTTKQLAHSLKNLILGVILGISVTACGQTDSEQNLSIKIDGSSTVYPLTQKIAEEFKQTREETANISVDFSGTGGGFKKFCAAQIDMNNASRPISTTEMTTCKEAGVAYIELPVAFDALTVVVNPANDWVESLTIQDLAKIWSTQAENKITRWNQVRPDFPDRPLNLFAPGEDSGTFDYFTEAIMGTDGVSRKDYVSSEDDNILVQGVRQDPNALSYFGLAYYEARQNEMKAVAIDKGEGAVLPTRETVESGEYQPLSRPLFIYVNSSAAQKNPILKEFVEFYLEQASEVVSEVGYVPLPEDGYLLTQIHFQRGKVGTVFGGESVYSLTIGELLRQQASF
ncbi:MAG: PstS family phosphate ABC transporter substrate-binding protein [Xenococcaceae cyanobacterium MO_188.B29]|nr:PstS family phosphate ABC transporter substrate-binding protein [Xenococcaceae cyanobacterium MO_188.B29]